MRFNITFLTIVAIAAMALSTYAGTLSPAYAQRLRSFAEAAQRSPRGKVCQEATCFFGLALCENRLPDCKNSEMVKFTADMGPFSEMKNVAYPVSFTFQLTKRNEKALYCYTVEKNSRFSGWHFTRAWKQTRREKRLAALSLPK
jgi:hypothetical protein